MKKHPFFPLVAIAATVLLLAACKKEDHFDPAHRWQIAKLDVYPGLSGSGDEAIFAYNSKGNPVSITRSTPSTGAPNYLFRYDPQQRLRDYVGVYGGGVVFEFWTRYYYDSQHRIAGDTTYNFGRVSDEGPIPDPDAPPPYNTLFIGSISTYHYDNENRVIKIMKTFPGSSNNITYNYNYNGQGNLAKVMISHSAYPEYNSETMYDQYDQKVNLHRTHPVWQFIGANFSRNNPSGVQAYNAHGLPVKLTAPDPKQESVFLSIYYSTLDVTYTATH